MKSSLASHIGLKHVHGRSADDSGGELTIGQLAKRFGLATHVLRHWEDVGLLEPAERVNGRRRYRHWHAARVAAILHAKQAGLTLERIREILDSDRERRVEVLKEQRAELAQRIEDMHVALNMIDHLLECTADEIGQCPGFQEIVGQHLAHPDATASR